MRCAACGTENDEGSKFCMTCGRSLADAAADQAPAGAEEAAAPDVPPAEPASSDGAQEGADTPAA
ncbi:MAG: zinc ribbon domain-containing protein, partial [Actinobacteria bacterium]|nr:zinc ribbon domain-containing protein [Actinomycetota bacterium]